MKLARLTAILFSMLILLLSSVPVDATPPTEIALDYNLSTHLLTVNVTHSVPNPKNHYIELLEVLKNDVFYTNKTFTNQSSTNGQITNFTVPAIIGDNLTVIATCSKGQYRSVWILVSTATSTSTTTTSTTTTNGDTDIQGVPSGLILIGAMAGLLLISLIIIIFYNREATYDFFRNIGSRFKSKIKELKSRVTNS